jgi:hypothetical protein
MLRFTEANSGEVITKPYLRKWLLEGYNLEALLSAALIAGLKLWKETYHKYFEHILGEPEPAYDDSPREILSDYNIQIENIWESVDNILKLHYIKKYHLDVALFVQSSQAFCCPPLYTEAMARQIKEKTRVFIISFTYDGT